LHVADPRSAALAATNARRRNLWGPQLTLPANVSRGCFDSSSTAGVAEDQRRKAPMASEVCKKLSFPHTDVSTKNFRPSSAGPPLLQRSREASCGSLCLFPRWTIPARMVCAGTRHHDFFCFLGPTQPCSATCSSRAFTASLSAMRAGPRSSGLVSHRTSTAIITACSSRARSSQGMCGMVYKMSVPQGAGCLPPAP
jgi:hypothetical protein